MSTQKKLITLCFATVFTLGLAACGGGGGGDAPVAGMMDGDVSLEGQIHSLVRHDDPDRHDVYSCRRASPVGNDS